MNWSKDLLNKAATLVLVLSLAACGGQPTEDLESLPANAEGRPVFVSLSPSGPANNTNPTVNGIAAPDAAIELFSNSSCTTSIATGTANASGVFAIAITVSDDSTTTIYGKATKDSVTSPCSTSFLTYAEDSTATVPTLASSTPVSPSNSNTPSITGTAERGSTVTLFSDSGCSSSLASGTANSSTGAFSIPVTVAENASTSIYARITDLAGNTSTCSTTTIAYVEDSTPPALPVVSAVTPVGPANNNAPVVNGTAEANAFVTLHRNAACTLPAGTATASGVGAWTINATVTDNTTTTFYALARDTAGNLSACSSTSVTYIEDSGVAAPILTGVTPLSPSTNNNPSIFGTAEAGSTVTLYSNSTCTTSLGSGTTDGAGSFSIAISVADNTTTRVWAKAVDTVGNTSACSTSSIQYIEDSASAPPVMVGSSPISPANGNSPAISGTAETGALVTLFSDSACTTSIGSGTATAPGVFSIPISVVDNSTTTVYGQTTDPLGNVSTCSSTVLTFVEDSVAPARPTVTASAPTSPATSGTPLINGTAEANVTVNLYSDAVCFTQVATGTANGSGNFSIGVSINEGQTITYYARARDAASNWSPCSTTSVTYTRVAVAVVSAPVLVDATPFGPANNNAPLINGTATPNSTVKLYSNAACTTQIGTGTASALGAFSISISVADNATVTVYGKATDGANESGCSTSSVTYVEDSTPPATPVVSASAPVSPANNNSPAITGSAETGATVTLYSNAACTTVLASGTAAAGAFSIPISVTNDSTTNVYARAVDAAGNASGCTASPLAFVEDSTAPNAPSISGSTPALRSSLSNIQMAGTAEAGSTVTLYSDAACTTQVASGVASGGAFDIAISAPMDVSVTYHGRATDAAGNASGCSPGGITYEAYSMPVGMAYLTGTQTTAPTTPTNLNQTTAYSIRWSASDYDYDHYSHSTSTNSHQLQVKVAGDYLLSLSMPSQAALAGANVRAEVRVNGTELSTGRAQSLYMSNTSGNDEGSNQLSVLLPNLAANDIIDVTVVRVGAAGTVPLTPSAALTVEYIEPTRTTFFATATQTNAPTTPTNLNQATAYALQWNSVVTDSGFTHSNATNPHNVTLDSIGDYMVHVNVPVSAALTNANIKVSVRLNGTIVAGGSATNGFIPNSNGQTTSSAHWSGMVRSTAANQILTITTTIEGNTGTVTVPAGRVASLFVERLPSTNDVFYAWGTQLTTGSTNLNAASATALRYTTNPVKDSFVYTHSTAANQHQITVLNSGDYLLTINTQTTSGAARQNVRMQVNVGGVAVGPARVTSFQTVNLNGNNEGSGIVTILLRKVQANQIITVTTVIEGATGTVTNQNSSIVLIRKPY